MNTQNTQEWKVIPDFAWQGRHPYHDARYVATSDHVDIVDNGDESDPPKAWRFEDPADCIICTMPDSPNQKAHAKLIAASPDLLAACKSALDWIDATRFFTGQPFAAEVKKRLENAIQKAEVQL